MIRFLCSVLISLSILGCAVNRELAAGAQSSTAARPGNALVAKVAEGGYVLYIRHGKTDSVFQDKQDKPNWWKTCDTRSEAETIVMKPMAEGKFEIVGRITADKWALRAQ